MIPTRGGGSCSNVTDPGLKEWRTGFPPCFGTWLPESCLQQQGPQKMQLPAGTGKDAASRTGANTPGAPQAASIPAFFDVIIDNIKKRKRMKTIHCFPSLLHCVVV